MTTITCKNKTFSPIQAIIFDKDGTLENSEPFLIELAIKRTFFLDKQISGLGDSLLSAIGLENKQLNPAGLMAVGSREENEIAAAAYVTRVRQGWFEALAIVRQAFKEADEYMARNQVNSAIFPDVKTVIEKFSHQGIVLGVLSSDSTTNVEKFLEEHHLSAYFDLKMGKNPRWSKPDPALFIHACEKLQVSPQHTLMVGDGLGDILMGKKAQARGVIGICRNPHHTPNWPDADVIIESLEQMI
ncbi:MAG: HAD family hydrolase [Microcystaceae cyanobacterium]